MTQASLNLVGDEDLEAMLEDAFDVRFTESEYRSMVNVGAIHDVINARLPARAGACETSMTFYRLRGGLIEMGMRGRVSPARPLPNSFSIRTYVQFNVLSKLSGLRLPTPPGGSLAMGCLLLGALAVLTFLIGLILNFAILGWITVATLIVAAIFWKLDRGQLPSGLRTVGDLVRQTAPLNFSLLASQGARVNSQATWNVLCEVIGDVAEITPDQISRETLVYTPKKAAA